MSEKSSIVIEKMENPYRIQVFDGKGQVKEEVWAPSRFRATQIGEELLLKHGKPIVDKTRKE